MSQGVWLGLLAAVVAMLARDLTVASAQPSLGATPSQARVVAVDLSSLSEPTFRAIDGAKLEKEIIARLVRFGMLVGRLGEGPTAVLGVTQDAQGFRLDVRCATARAGEVAVAYVRWTADRDPTGLTALHYEIAAKATALLSGHCPAFAETAPGKSSVRPPKRWQLGVGLATVTRQAAPARQGVKLATDAGVLLVAGRARRQWQLYGKASVGSANTGELKATEVALQVGASRLLMRQGRWQLRVGLEGGLLMHRYQLAAAATARLGTVLDGLLGVPVGLCANLGEAWQLCTSATASTTLSAARAHYVNDTLIWYRGGFRVGMDVFASVAL